MHLPVRLAQHHPLQRLLAAGVIALICSVLGVILRAPVGVFGVVRGLDEAFYDAMYRLRPTQKMDNGPIVIVAVDDESIEKWDKERKVGWPWPRKYWGEMVSYLDAAGAKAVVIDLLFNRSSVYNNASNHDDQTFAEAIDASATPTVLATMARADGSTWNLAPPLMNKRTGAVNMPDEDVIRSYAPVINGQPSLALAAMAQLKIRPPEWALEPTPFLLHYYGPHAVGNSTATFKYIRAANLLEAAENPDREKYVDISPGMFKDKIVLIATITAGTYELKTSPLSALYPGVEIHATALQNMLSGQRVTPVGAGLRVLMLIVVCLAAAAGTLMPARVPLTVVGGASGAMLALGTSAALFLKQDMRWMPPGAEVIAAVLAAFVGLSWRYLTELRQRRFVLKAMAQYVSKSVVDQIAGDPRKLSLSGERRDMTVMFTDLANFTSLSESMEVHSLADMLNFYLQEMSSVILSQDGTLDKYIGDSIMSFWNAPVNQTDHAHRACRAALEMRRREKSLAVELSALARGAVHSRMGINSGPMIVGNMGSSFKFDYTVLGDSVNLASRLESANKMYGTQILLSETSANLVKDNFLVRKVDLLRVKGKQQPMAIYELMTDGTPESAMLEIVRRYESALALYQSRDFEKSWELLIALAQDFPEDGPTATLMGRVLKFRDEPPPEDWDGVYVAKEK
jgi:adenylate cyclase